MTLSNIQESFQQDMRLFELFNKDVQGHIAVLKQETADFQAYLESGTSIEIKPTIIQKPDGRTSGTMGVSDNPRTREVLAWATERRLAQTGEYIDISLRMALSHLLGIFDAKFMDVMTIYLASIPEKLEPGQTVEEKVLKFAYKSFKSQLNSIVQNLRIDMKKLLGEPFIEQLVEIRETRNIIIHNSGKVSESYLKKVVNPTFQFGDLRLITAEYLETSVHMTEQFFYTFCDELGKKTTVI